MDRNSTNVSDSWSSSEEDDDESVLRSRALFKKNILPRLTSARGVSNDEETSGSSSGSVKISSSQSTISSASSQSSQQTFFTAELCPSVASSEEIETVETLIEDNDLTKMTVGLKQLLSINQNSAPKCEPKGPEVSCSKAKEALPFDSVENLKPYFKLEDCIGERFVISRFKSYDRIHILPASDSKIRDFRDDFFHLIDEINDFCMDASKLNYSSLYKGQVVCVPNEETGQFARGSIEKINKGVVTVVLLEYGSELTFGINALHSVNKEIMKWGIFGQQVELAGISKDFLYYADKGDLGQFIRSHLNQVVILKEVDKRGRAIFEIPLQRCNKVTLNCEINEIQTWKWEKCVRACALKTDEELIKAMGENSGNVFMIDKSSTKQFRLNTEYTGWISQLKIEGGTITLNLYDLHELCESTSAPYFTYKRILDAQLEKYGKCVKATIPYFPKNNEFFLVKFSHPCLLGPDLNIKKGRLNRAYRDGDGVYLVDFGVKFPIDRYSPSEGVCISVLASADPTYQIMLSEFSKFPGLSITVALKDKAEAFDSEDFFKKNKTRINFKFLDKDSDLPVIEILAAN